MSLRRLVPRASVVAATQFFGVPEEVLPEGGLAQIHAMGQDQGTDLERLIECAGRECYDSYGKGRSSEEYHRHILDVQHGSVTEHATISFRLWDISRGLTHELVRHRAGIAISQRSTRYVDESESDWAWHPLIWEAIDWGKSHDGQLTRTAAENAEFSMEKCMGQARMAYNSIQGICEAYLATRGVSGTDRRKQARGAARGALGNALATSMIWTANIRTLRFCIEQRANPAADGEIRLEFDFIYEAACKFCPAYFGDYQRVETSDGIGFGLVPNKRKI